MEFHFLNELQPIAICFNNLKETLFILYKQNINKIIIHPNNLSLVEQDIHHKIIHKRFKLLQRDECNIINKGYKKYPDNCYEGYSLSFWHESEKLFLLYPFSYILIFDYKTTDLIYHFQYPGMKFFTTSTLLHPFKVSTGKCFRYYALRNIIGSPIENVIFITGLNIHYVYCLDLSILYNDNNDVSDYFANKFFMPNAIIYDIILHPYDKFLYIGFSDGIVRVYNYNNIRDIRELTINLIDTSDNKSQKNIINNEPDPVICLDINTVGNYLLEGTERGNIYLWDAFLANKNKKILFKKETQEEGIFSLKFIKTKQFGNIQKFICLTQKGNIVIYNIVAKDDSIYQPEGRKKPLIEITYKNCLFDNLRIPNSILKYDILLNSLINISYNNNIISISWPKFKELEKEEKANNNDCTLIYDGLITKNYFFFSSKYPKVNLPASIQLKTRFYEEYIPSKNMPNFENKIYYTDNYCIYLYDISTSRHRTLINYYKETQMKSVLLKFEIKDMITKVFFFILIETGLHRNNLIVTDFDFINNTYTKPRIIYNINDIVILGNSYLNLNSDNAFLLGRDMITGFILTISTGNLEQISLDTNIIRVYHSPFNQGYCIILRSDKNEFKFSQNFTPEIFPSNNNININNILPQNLFNFKCGDLLCFKLEKNEFIIDILFNIISDVNFCAVSMINKINIYNREMKLISRLLFNFNESPYIISSLFFIDNTLIYSKNDSIYYYYPRDNYNQLILRNNRKPICISGILPDRFIIVAQTDNSNISISDITSPMINPLETILIGYLDSPNINYDLLKLCVVNMFTNQISQYLINKLINKNLKEIAWLFIDDDKSSFQNIDIKLNLMNENFQFDKIIENILVKRDLKNELNLDDIIWKLKYDSSYQYIKDLLIKELKILIEFGQYNSALKILELLGDYPQALNLLLISTSLEDYDRLRMQFQAKEALNFTDALLGQNPFTFTKNNNNIDNINKINANKILNNIYNLKSANSQDKNEDIIQDYHKIFDNYVGDHFIFGANTNEFKINYIEDIQQKIEEKIGPKEKGLDAGIQKKDINFGEKPFNIYSYGYNISKQENQVIEIYSLILQKIENYYGIIKRLSKNEKEKMNKKMTFNNNNNLSLQQIISSNQINQINTKSSILSIQTDDLDENDFDEDISEDLYLCAYYHCDRGNGEILEDITQNENDAIIKCIYNDNNNNNNDDKKDLKKKQKENNEENNKEDNMKNIWSEILDENRPLEYEDKWGRRSPPARAIIFTKLLRTKILINNSNLLLNIEEKFTIEFWIKLKDINNINIFTKDSFTLDIDNALFKLSFRDQEIPHEIIKEYSLPMNQYVHIAILYKRSSKILIILLNCEEIIRFNIVLSGIESNTPFIFGNEKLDAEMTEIRIWNQKIPIEFIKENYKAPLPILAENKGKLKMNIDKNTNYKQRYDSVFISEEKENDLNLGDSNNKINSISCKSIRNINNIAEVIDNSYYDNNININEEEYPTIDVVNYNKSNNNEINNKVNDNYLSRSYTNNLFIQEKSFIFDK